MDSQLNSANVDEAQEKLFGESNSSGGSKIEIKFVTDPKNGDTKIDISEVKQVFVGMGKEELMKFANDPFWVRMRWILFILFWVLWFGMLAGAIAIILLAPKCSAPEPVKWYEESPIYHVNVKNFFDSNDDGVGDLSGLESKLDYIKDLGMGGILLEPLMKTAEGTDDVIDFKSISPDYGSSSDLKRLINTAKSKGLHVLMKIIPNFSSIKHEWFSKSVAKEEPFTDYYVWTDAVHDSDGKLAPRNKWLSVNGGPAWTWDDTRQQFYLHQFNRTQPDLNFRNTEVVKYFEDVYKFWLDHGLSGLYLDKVEYLVENKDFIDERPSPVGISGQVHDEYGYYYHTYTTHLQESWDIVSNWSNVFKNHSAVVIVSGVPELKEADLIWRPIKVTKSLKSSELEEMLLKRLNKTSQVWGFSCDDCDERMRIGLQAVLLMLPGSVIFPSGLELGLPPSSIFQWDSTAPNKGFTKGTPWIPLSAYENSTVSLEKKNADSYYNNFKKIIKERRSSIMHGMTKLSLNSSVLTFTRTRSATPHYFVAFNIEDSPKTINIEDFLKDPSKLTLIAGQSNDQILSNDASTKLTVPGTSCVVLRYIPDSGE